MSNNTDITALISSLQTAVNSAQGSSTTLASFVNNSADSPVNIGGTSVPSLQGIVAQAIASANRRMYDITLSQDDLTAYANAAHPLARVYLPNATTFPKDLAGSIFQLAASPNATLKLQINLAGTLMTVTFAIGQTVGTVTALQVDTTVASGSAVTISIPGALNNASGLSVTLVGSLTQSS